jgi:hypothetical protein
MPKGKPPDTTDQILDDIRRSNAAILATADKSLDLQKEQLDAAESTQAIAGKSLQLQNKQSDVANESLDVLKQQLNTANKSLDVENEQLKVLKQIRLAEKKQLKLLKAILKALLGIFENTKPHHVYTLIISKEKPPMAVQPGVGSAFKVIMQDNGNPITPPDGTVYSWITDNADDVIEEKSIDGSFSLVAITANGDDPERTTMTITVTGADPNGEPLEGSLVVDVVPGVEQHTFTLVIQQLLDPSINPLVGRKPESSQLPAPTLKHKK